MLLLALLVGLPAAHAGEWAVPEKAWTAYERARSALDALDPALGEKLARKALKQADDDCAPCQGVLAMAVLRQDRAQEAWELLIPLVPEFPEEGPLLELASAASFAARQFEDSRNLALAAVTTTPDSPTAHGLLLQANMRLGEHEDARLVLATAERSLPGGMLACLHARLAQEEERWDDMIEAALACEDIAEQQALLYNASLRNPTDVELQKILAEQVDRRGLGRYHEARRLRRDGAYAEALALIDSIAAERSETFDQRIFRLGLLEALGRREEALEMLVGMLDQEDWIQVTEEGSMFGITTERNLRAFESQKALLAIWRVVLLEALGRPDEATAMAATAGRATNTPEATVAAQAWLRARAGDPEGAWKMVSAAPDWLDSLAGQWFLGKLVVEAGARIPDDLVAKLDDIARENLDISRSNAEALARADAYNAKVAVYNETVGRFRQATAGLSDAIATANGGDAPGCLADLDRSMALLDGIDPSVADALKDIPPGQLADDAGRLRNELHLVRFHCLVNDGQGEAARALAAAHPDLPYALPDRWNLILLAQEEAGREATEQALRGLCESLDEGDEKRRCVEMLPAGQQR